MDINSIKAPIELKNKTMERMNTTSHPSSRKHLKNAIIVAILPIVFSISVFAHSLFSGIDGDNLSLIAEYKGDGNAVIIITNLADKNLKFDNTIKLKEWSTNKEIFELTQKMPSILPNETTEIEISLPYEYLEFLETPLFDSNSYYFWLTTNRFVNGQSFMASISFTDNISSDHQGEEYIETFKLDTTTLDDIEFIKSNFIYQNPIPEISVTADYNSLITENDFVHAELDLKADLGAEILPFASGLVLDTGFSSGIGLYIVIDHKNGLISKYTHCNEILKNTGDDVSLNDVIALVGQTGSATGPHLSFSLYLNETPVNPQHFLVQQP